MDKINSTRRAINYGNTNVQLQHRTQAFRVRRDDECCQDDDQRGGYGFVVLVATRCVRWIVVGVVFHDLLGVEPFDLRPDDFARHETLDGEGQQDRDGKQDPGKVHQIVVPAVVFQQVTCKKGH